MKFKVGQQVECLIAGRGIIENITEEFDFYPIHVKFDTGKMLTYTIDGRPSVMSKISLTSGTWKVEEILPEPKFEKGDPVWCRDDDGQEWRLRYYKLKENKKHFVYIEQKKSGRGVHYNFIKPFEGTDPNN